MTSGEGGPNRCPAVLVRNLTVQLGDSQRLLDHVSFEAPQGHFAAVIGPSGCGKSTLLRSLAGMVQPSRGEIRLMGHPLADYKRRFPMALGYLPQFSEAHEDLTVFEILKFSAALQLPESVSRETRFKWLTYLMEMAGLGEIRNQRYRTLSGGQRRRMALAETLIADPPIMLVDELTSGLDPHAESSMMEWLRFLAHRSGKTILLVTHAIQSLEQTDSVLFMKQGRLGFHGGHEELRRAYGITHLQELYQKEEIAPPPSDPSDALDLDLPDSSPRGEEVRTAGPSSWATQFLALARRQFLLLKRDRLQLALHAVILLTFPALVAVFAMGGLPQVRNLSLNLDANILRSLREQLLYLKDSMASATLISGLIMFQVILLTLAGANNGSREIAKERSVLEKEQRCGLSTLAYVSSKWLLVILLSLLQAVWMTWFVKTICKFPGEFGVQSAILFLTTLAMSTTCLAISAYSSSTEKSSLQAIYLVGLQLPLSGAVLALPEWLVWITRPFIAAYWGWSGYLKSLSDYRLYDVVRQTTQTWLASPGWVCGVLALHIGIAFALCSFFASRRHRSFP